MGDSRLLETTNVQQINSMIRSWFASSSGMKASENEEAQEPSNTDDLSDDTGTFRPFPSSGADAARAAARYV